MAYSFKNQNMSTISNILVIHAVIDKGEISDTTAFTIPLEVMARVMKTSYGKICSYQFYPLLACSA